MRLDEIISKAADSNGETLYSHAWRVEVPHSTLAMLIHYKTMMLEWNPQTNAISYVGLGRGSVADQNGVNIALKTLGANLRYRRDKKGGGPRIDTIKLHPFSLERFQTRRKNV